MSSGNKKIGIVGLGGIGGFIGAPLVKHYKENEGVQIIFICRGRTKDAICQNGLTIESSNDKYTVHPALVSDDPNEIGMLDVLIIACKSYSLDKVVSEYKRCIKATTVIITLQNMVNAKEVIQHTLPDHKHILEGCIYVASNVKQSGYILHVGGPGKIYIDGEQEHEWLLELLQNGGLDVSFVKNIKEVLWKKFLFVAPVAAITTAYNITFGQLADDKAMMETLENMMVEIQSLAKINNIVLTDEDILASREMLSKFPYQSKSSLQLDFEGNKQTEKYFLVDYVIENALKNGIAPQYYESINAKISAL